jgi:hypothetical protein
MGGMLLTRKRSKEAGWFDRIEPILFRMLSMVVEQLDVLSLLQ